MTIIARIFSDRKGTAAIEYALLVSLVALVAAGSIGEIGSTLSNVFATVDSAMTVR